jgi:hypothetical protein
LIADTKNSATYCDISLPPILQQSIHEALAKGILFPDSTLSGRFLPEPKSLRKIASERSYAEKNPTVQIRLSGIGEIQPWFDEMNLGCCPSDDSSSYSSFFNIGQNRKAISPLQVGLDQDRISPSNPTKTRRIVLNADLAKQVCSFKSTT